MPQCRGALPACPTHSSKFACMACKICTGRTGMGGCGGACGEMHGNKACGQNRCVFQAPTSPSSISTPSGPRLSRLTGFCNPRTIDHTADITHKRRRAIQFPSWQKRSPQRCTNAQRARERERDAMVEPAPRSPKPTHSLTKQTLISCTKFAEEIQDRTARPSARILPLTWAENSVIYQVLCLADRVCRLPSGRACATGFGNNKHAQLTRSAVRKSN
jgi:hypothetical protein